MPKIVSGYSKSYKVFKLVFWYTKWPFNIYWMSTAAKPTDYNSRTISFSPLYTYHHCHQVLIWHPVVHRPKFSSAVGTGVQSIPSHTHTFPNHSISPWVLQILAPIHSPFVPDRFQYHSTTRNWSLQSVLPTAFVWLGPVSWLYRLVSSADGLFCPQFAACSQARMIW